MEKSHAKRKSVKSSIELIILLITLSTSPVKTFGTVVKGETEHSALSTLHSGYLINSDGECSMREE